MQGLLHPPTWASTQSLEVHRMAFVLLSQLSEAPLLVSTVFILNQLHCILAELTVDQVP